MNQFQTPVLTAEATPPCVVLWRPLAALRVIPWCLAAHLVHCWLWGALALACFARTSWETCLASLALQAPLTLLASLALKILLNATPKVKSLGVKVKSHKEVGHLNKVWLVTLQSKSVILSQSC